jgi:hypothetical protein
MNLNTIKAFRHEVYGCIGKAKDALSSWGYRIGS